MISRILGGFALIEAIVGISRSASSIPGYFMMTLLMRVDDFTILFLDNALSASSEVLSGVRLNSNAGWVKDLVRRMTGHTLAPPLFFVQFKTRNLNRPFHGVQHAFEGVESPVGNER